MQYPYDGRRWSAQDWAQARGLGSIDYDGFILLVRGPVEPVARVIARDTDTWVPDALGRTVVSDRDALLVYRLCGHRWSIVLSRAFADVPYGKIGHAWERTLSRQLQTEVIAYGTSDTCGSIGYTWVVSGVVVEDFFAEDVGSRACLERSQFSSTRRHVELREIDNIYNFTNDFFVERDAFDPAIPFEAFFGHTRPAAGAHVAVTNPELITVYPTGEVRDIPEMERVDYLTLKPESSSRAYRVGTETPPDRPD